MAVHEGFRTTAGGLRDCIPLRLYQKARRLGVWDPAAVDFAQDRGDWESLDELQRETILSLTSYATAQFGRRDDRIARARGKSLAEIDEEAGE